MTLQTKWVFCSLLFFVMKILDAQNSPPPLPPPPPVTQVANFSYNRLVSLKEVTYSGVGLTQIKDDMDESVYPSNWTSSEPNKQNPISYYSGSKLKIKAKFDLTCSGFDPSKIRIQAYIEPTTSTPGMKFQIQKPKATKLPNSQSQYELEYIETEANTAFIVNQIAYVENFNPKWVIAYDGVAWEDVPNQSSNELYVTWRKPALESAPDIRLDRYLYLHTIFHLVCKPYNGIVITDINDLTGSIWKLFDKNNLASVAENTNLYRKKDNLPLKYYADYLTAANSIDCPSLIKTGNAQCNGFAQLFLSMLRVQGYTDTNHGVNVYVSEQSSPLCDIDVIRDRRRINFMVKRWLFKNPSTSYPRLDSCSLLPYKMATIPIFLNQTDEIGLPYNLFGHPFHQTYLDVKDNIGGAGQNNTNPASLFNGHFIIKIANTYYDPSYGVTYQNANEMRDNYLDGWCLVTLNRKTEIELNMDIDGDGIKSVIRFNIWSVSNQTNLFSLNFE